MRDIDPGRIRKILVREVNWVGDAVLTLPALEALDRRFPEAEIVVVGRPWVAGLFGGQRSVDRVLAYESAGVHGGLAGRWALARRLRGEGFDLAMLFPNSFESAVVPWLAGIPHRVGYPTDGRRFLLTHPVKAAARAGERHQVFRYLNLARALGGSGGDLAMAGGGECPPNGGASPKRTRRAAVGFAFGGGAGEFTERSGRTPFRHSRSDSTRC